MTSAGRRPLIAIPARFSSSAAALRYAADVTARKLAEAVFRAGGEPLTVHPHAPTGDLDTGTVASRLGFVDGVLLPGGGDLAPSRYGGAEHTSLYDVDAEQDAFDLATARWCLDSGVPLLAICRGLQVANVARGGSLVQDMSTHHRHVVSELDLTPSTHLRDVLGQDRVRISCYHHQAVDRVGAGLRATATSADQVVEALETQTPGNGWFLAVQWHPEDTADSDPAQQAVFDALVRAARAHAPVRG